MMGTIICQKVVVSTCLDRAPCESILPIRSYQTKQQDQTGMPRRKTRKHRKTSRKARWNEHPARPGPKVCSPLAETRRNGSSSCLPSDVVKRIASTLPTRGGSAGDNTNTTKELAKELGCKKDNSRCIIERSLLSHKEKKALLNAYFRPKMPDEWKKNPQMWLSSDDISNVMQQYEKAYPEFRFLGVVPIDFSAPDPYSPGPKKCMNNQFCEVNLAEEKSKGRRILGAVFNLDPHYKSGSHWIALAIDLQRNCVYYFDSYGIAPPNQIARFMRYLTLQEPRLKLQSNGRRFQYSDTECGMYSMYFIIRMIAGESFKKFCKNPIHDKWMIEFRNTLFDNNSTAV